MPERPVVHQCKTCPWKKGATLAKIPGYCPTKHAKLRETIAEPGAIDLSGPLRVMACHCEDKRHCAGWVVHQIGPGNNIALRMNASRDKKFSIFKTVGPQHATFEDTFEKDRP